MEFNDFNILRNRIDRLEHMPDKLSNIGWGLDNVRIAKERLQEKLDSINAELKVQNENEHQLRSMRAKIINGAA